MLCSYTCSERLLRNQLLAVNTATYNQTRSHTSVQTCNQTGLTAIRHWQNTNTVTLSFCRCHTYTYTHQHTHINAVAQCTNICHFINRSHTNKKEKMIVRCSQSVHSDTHVPGNVRRGMNNLSIGRCDQKQCREENGTRKLSA